MTTRMVPTRREVVDVGHLCDVSCLHCYHRFENDKSFRSKESIMQDIATAKRNGNTYIDFTGGEPTLHPDVVECVEYANYLELKCCIITNGLQAESDVTLKLIGVVDDWLISTHGNEADHNKIVGFDCARVQQETFVNLLEKHKRTYRVNCCILSHNQFNLVEFAEWAATKERLRIVNFINFNPHGVWNNHPEARAQMCDMDIVEEQLNRSIAILEQAGKGINVRYFPMCRIAEENRKYICNDMHVMHDPYEWSYGVTPKTNERYMQYAHEISGNNELKSAGCFTCNIRSVCGGINKAFYQMADNKKIIKPVIDGLRERDPFLYRRHNDPVLVDRNPLNVFCVAVIADDTMRWYVPLFIYSAAMNCPDTRVIVFARYTDHERLREIVDSALGTGYYDSVVVDVTSDLIAYPEHPIATATLRFLVFEEQLSMYKYVLWTDIDMLLFSPHLLKDHVGWLDHIWGESSSEMALYENGCAIPDGSTLRLSGVHFIKQVWWNKTAEQRSDELKKLEKMVSFPRHYDENVLYNIVVNSGLAVPEKSAVVPIQRHHGVHLGDWRYGTKESRAPVVTDEIEYQIRRLMSDVHFETILRESASMVPAIRSIEALWQSTYARGTEKTLLPEYEKQLQADRIGVKRKRKFNLRHYEGSLAIVVMCDEGYAWFAPLFAHSAQSLRATHPGMKVFILYRRDDNDEKIFHEMFSHIPDEYATVLSFFSEIPKGGYFTAAARFSSSFDFVKDFDYTLITDIDIMLMPEERTIIDSHMMHMDRDGTECYENWISDRRGDKPRIPGVHFVTKEWWDRTADARTQAHEDLCARKEIEYCHDEYMLGSIIQNSGVPLPPAEQKLWRKHGPHIGDLRLDSNRKRQYMPNVWEGMHIRRLMADPEFLNRWSKAEEHIDYLPAIRKMWLKIINQ